MIRRLSYILVVVSLIVAAHGLAVAGTTLFGGITAPTGDMGDAYDSGYHGGLDLHIPIVPLIFSAGPTVIYNKLNLSGQDESTGYLELLGTASFTFPLGPRVMGGAGWTFPVQKPDLLSNSIENEFTVVVGTGWKFLLVDARAMWHKMGDSSFLTLSVGMGF